MSKVAKYIIVILALLFLASIFLSLQSSSGKDQQIKQYQNRQAELSKTADSLQQQLNSARDEKNRIQSKMDAMQKDFAKLTSERDDWKNKYDAAVKEKEQLVTKLQEMPAAVEQPKEVVAQQPVVTDEYWAGVLKDKAALELQLKALQDQLGDNRLQLEDLKKTKTEMELELSRLKRNQDDLERKVKYSTDLANTLSLELARDKNDKKFIADKLAAIKEENSTLRAQVKDLATAKVSLNKGLQKLSHEKTDLEAQLTKTEEIIQSRVSDMMDIKNELEAATHERAATGIEGKVVQLPPIVVKAQGMGQKETAASTGSERTAARVVSLNESNNFVIIDIGASSGVKPGDTFKVYHDAKEIAIVEVIQARNDISAADIKQKIQNISVGDLVK